MDNSFIWNLLTIILTPIVSFIAVVYAQRKQGQAQHKNWLIQRRSEAFSDLLEGVHDCVAKSAIILMTSSDPRNQQSREIGNLWWRAVVLKARIARLYVRKEDRDGLEKLAHELLSLHIEHVGDKKPGIMIDTPEGEATRKMIGKKFVESENSLRMIMERNLSGSDVS
jgi:hypothetical protein